MVISLNIIVTERAQICQWLVADRWFYPGTPVSSTNKTDRHDIAEILLKVVLNRDAVNSQQLRVWWEILTCIWQFYMVSIMVISLNIIVTEPHNYHNLNSANDYPNVVQDEIDRGKTANKQQKTKFIGHWYLLGQLSPGFPIKLLITFLIHIEGPSWSWSYGSWIYSYMCNQCLWPLKLWVRILMMARCTRCNIAWSSLSVTCSRSMVLSGYSGFLHTKNKIYRTLIFAWTAIARISHQTLNCCELTGSRFNITFNNISAISWRSVLYRSQSSGYDNYGVLWQLYSNW
jgi:hypothetical protein